MPQSIYKFPAIADISRIVVFGKNPNSSYDFYIAPRLSDKANAKISFVELETFQESSLPKNIEGMFVIVNRYINPKLLRWIRKNHHKLTGVMWFLDDDLDAMVKSSSIPFLKKIRPLQTLLLARNFKPFVNCLVLATKPLKDQYHSWPTMVIPPVVNIKQVNTSRINPKKMFYFAKMHAAEHRFLFPIINYIINKYSDATFTVVANKQWKKRWSQLPRVTVIPEMEYEEYSSFLDTLEEGGTFLIPLTNSLLNDARSDAKIIDAVRSGSIPLFSVAKAYGEILEYDQNIARAKTEKQWIETLEKIFEFSEFYKSTNLSCERFLSMRYKSRSIFF